MFKLNGFKLEEKVEYNHVADSCCLLIKLQAGIQALFCSRTLWSQRQGTEPPCFQSVSRPPKNITNYDINVSCFSGLMSGLANFRSSDLNFVTTYGEMHCGIHIHPRKSFRMHAP